MKWTIHKAALEWGIDRRTLASRLGELGENIGKGSTWHTRIITRAVVGDLDQEKILETRERRKLLALERAEKEKHLVPLDHAERLIAESFVPVRQRLLALPSEVSHRCNPSDPALARDALVVWVDRALPAIRGGLPDPDPVPVFASKPTRKPSAKPKPKPKKKGKR